MPSVYDEGLALCPATRLDDHPSSAVHGCLFSIFRHTLCIWRLVSSSSILRTCYAVVTRYLLNVRKFSMGFDLHVGCQEEFDKYCDFCD
jgi:hypothetical protein